MATHGEIRVEIYNTANPPVLQGTITTAVSAGSRQYKSRSGSGTVSLPLQMPAAERDLLVSGRIAVANVYDATISTWLELACFTIIKQNIRASSQTSYLDISGPDLLQELATKSVDNLPISFERTHYADMVSDNISPWVSGEDLSVYDYAGYNIRSEDNLHFSIVVANNASLLLVEEHWTDGTPTFPTNVVLYGVSPTDIGVQKIMAFAPAGWTTTYESGDGTSAEILHAFNGENVLEALIATTDQTGEFFRLSSLTQARNLAWRQTADDSGVTLFMPSYPTENEGNTAFAVIKSLTRNEDFAVVSHLTPYGAGAGEDRLSLKNANIPLPSGFDWIVDGNGWKTGIKNTTLEAAGTHIEKEMTWSQIQAISDEAVANPAAANALASTALTYLQKRASNEYFYRVRVIAHTDNLRPGRQVTLTYTDNGQNPLSMIHSGADKLYIQEVGHSVGRDGIRYTDLLLTETALSRRDDDADVVANTMSQQLAGTRHNSASAPTTTTPGSGGSTSDHGELTGLADDDHVQYLLANGNRNLTGSLAVAPGATIDGVDISAHPNDPDIHHSPGTLSINSVNQNNGIETHAITTSSNPGISAAILATDTLGRLQLEHLTIGSFTLTDRTTGQTYNLFINNGRLYIEPI